MLGIKFMTLIKLKKTCVIPSKHSWIVVDKLNDTILKKENASYSETSIHERIANDMSLTSFILI
jgi:hypothetical protein